MLIKANRKNLKQHARALLGDRYTPERERELIKVALDKPKSYFGAKHLSKIDVILGTHGVEGFLQPAIVAYCNTGETYGMTLLYWKAKLWIGDWGSIVEECESAA